MSSSRPRGSPSERDTPARRERRRRTHRREDSHGELLSHTRRERDARRRSRDSYEPASPSKQRPKDSHRRPTSRPASSDYGKSTTTALSSAQLAQLDRLNRKLGWSEYDGLPPRPPLDEDDLTRAEFDEGREREERERAMERERRRRAHRERRRRQREERRASHISEMPRGKRGLADENPSGSRRPVERVVSGQRLERGRGSEYYSEKESTRWDVRRRKGSSDDTSDEVVETRWTRRKKWILIGIAIIIVLIIIIVSVAIVETRKHRSAHPSGSESDPTSGSPSNSNLDGISESSIPAWAKGNYYDPFTWYDTDDFNVTVTNATIGGLPVMGLNSSWDDTACANTNVPCLNEKWTYDGSMKIRGVNLGGWLSIEPWITPSLFSGYDTSQKVVDEWTLCQTLGASKAATTLEKHYSSFVDEATFAEIQAAGFDHIRIPFSYWAVTTYDGDPYVKMISWRYLLRGIEWARKHGLRVNLDLHGVPGSQNGWQHSGHQGSIGWLNGTDGQLNGDRTLHIHDQLSQFFTAPRYKNIITLYGLVNEPRMTALDTDQVLNWTTYATKTVQGNNFTGVVVFGDGFMGLGNWQGELQGLDNLLLDVHQYVVFNVEQIVLNHHDKINFACGGWTAQSQQSMNSATGFGPTLCGEWSQADTDCAQYLNNVGVGSRWEGTLNYAGVPNAGGIGGSDDGSVLTPTCPTGNNPQCQCSPANADPSSYSAQYKQWLKMFAEAQMYSFEVAWGWFYWTWQTEAASQWSYKAGMAAGILPAKTWERDFWCNTTIPMFNETGLPEYY